MTAAEPYDALTYGGRAVGFGRRPGVVVVDLQCGFTEPRYPMGGRPLVEAATVNTARLLESARRAGAPVASCVMAYKSGDDMPYWKIPAMYEGTFFTGHPAAQLDARIYDADYDLKVTKTAPSIFFSTPVHQYFTKREVDTVIVCGCMTAGCVRASVIDSFSHGWRTIVPEECVGDVDAAPHQANLLDIRRRYADVLPADAVIAYLDGLTIG